MRILIICLLFVLIISDISCAKLSKRQAKQHNLQEIQQLLQELEKANVNINEISNQVSQVNKNSPNSVSKESDTPVRDALSKLFNSFQQMASAYVGVLTSVGKSIGLPTIGVQYMQTSPVQPIGIKQIGENIRQFQDSVQEVSKNINNFFTRQAPVEQNVVVNQMRKFMKLWSTQIQELSDQVTRAFGGLQASTSEGSSITIPLPFLDFFQNMMRVFEETFSDITQRVTRIFSGGNADRQQPIDMAFYEDQKPSNMDLLKEFKNLLEIIQKRMKTLSQQLEGLVSSNSTDKQKEKEKDKEKDKELPAEHKTPEYF